LSGTVVLLRSHLLSHYIGKFDGDRFSLVHFTHQVVFDYFTQECGEKLFDNLESMPKWYRDRENKRAAVSWVKLGFYFFYFFPIGVLFLLFFSYWGFISFIFFLLAFDFFYFFHIGVLFISFSIGVLYFFQLISIKVFFFTRSYYLFSTILSWLFFQEPELIT
jgi:hypothetical protein